MIDDLFSQFSDQTVYFVMGSVGSILFFLRLVLLLIGGIGGEGMEADADGALDGDGGGLSLFSSLSIMSFLMGAGWMGLACRSQWEMGQFLAALCASGFGFGLMLFSSAGMLYMRKFNQAGDYDLQTVVGHTGRVYLRIPARGEGAGQVQITVNGRSKVLPAVSTGAQLDSFVTVKVSELRDDNVLVVEPA